MQPAERAALPCCSQRFREERAGPLFLTRRVCAIYLRGNVFVRVVKRRVQRIMIPILAILIEASGGNRPAQAWWQIARPARGGCGGSLDRYASRLARSCRRRVWRQFRDCWPRPACRRRLAAPASIGQRAARVERTAAETGPAAATQSGCARSGFATARQARR